MVHGAKRHPSPMDDSGTPPKALKIESVVAEQLNDLYKMTDQEDHLEVASSTFLAKVLEKNPSSNFDIGFWKNAFNMAPDTQLDLLNDDNKLMLMFFIGFLAIREEAIPRGAATPEQPLQLPGLEERIGDLTLLLTLTQNHLSDSIPRAITEPAPMSRQQMLDSPGQSQGFPWNEIPLGYPSKLAIEEILGQAAQEWKRRLEPTEVDLPFWRAVQVIASKNQLDFNSDECKGKTNSECLRLLLDCVLHHFESKETTGPPPISTPSAEMKLFSSTFLEVEYATNLLNHIASLSHEYYGDNDYHSPYVSLVQASMTGKSRVIKEMAKSVYCIFICLRKKGDSGYPRATFSELFDDYRRAGTMDRVQRIICLFATMVEQLTSLIQNSNSPETFWDDQEKAVNQGGQAYKRLVSQAYDSMLGESYSVTVSSDAEVEIDDVLKVRLETTWSEFSKYINPKHCHSGLKLLICVDEATRLLDDDTEVDDRSLAISGR